MKTELSTENLVERLKDKDYFIVDSNTKEEWVVFTVNGEKNTAKVNSSIYRNRIQHMYYSEYQRPLPKGVLEEIIAILAAYTKFEAEQKQLFLRVGEIGESFFYDLCNEFGDVVEISNVIKIKPTRKIIFKKFEEQKKQIISDKGKKLSGICKYINIAPSEQLLFVVYIVSCFIPNIQHPILLLHGESGNGKSTISTMIKELVDPSKNALTKTSSSEADLYLSIERNWLTVFDNESKLSSKMSDNLCRVVTGIAISRRKLYTDNDAVSTNVKQCIILNGIENIATKEDLLNRSLIFEVIRKKESEVVPFGDLMREFEHSKPEFLREIFNVLLKAKGIYTELTDFKCTSRMAEFEKWGFAIGQVISGDGELFLKQYRANTLKQENEAIASNTLVSAIEIILNGSEKGFIELRPSDLLHKIQQIAYKEGLSIQSDTMPKDAVSVTKKLKAYKTLLQKIGIEFKHNGHTREGSQITLRKRKGLSQPSQDNAFDMGGGY